MVWVFRVLLVRGPRRHREHGDRDATDDDLGDVVHAGADGSAVAPGEARRGATGSTRLSEPNRRGLEAVSASSASLAWERASSSDRSRGGTGTGLGARRYGRQSVETEGSAEVQAAASLRREPHPSRPKTCTISRVERDDVRGDALEARARVLVVARVGRPGGTIVRLGEEPIGVVRGEGERPTRAATIAGARRRRGTRVAADVARRGGEREESREHQRAHRGARPGECRFWESAPAGVSPNFVTDDSPACARRDRQTFSNDFSNVPGDVGRHILARAPSSVPPVDPSRTPRLASRTHRRRRFAAQTKPSRPLSCF